MIRKNLDCSISPLHKEPSLSIELLVVVRYPIQRIYFENENIYYVIYKSRKNTKIYSLL